MGDALASRSSEMTNDVEQTSKRMRPPTGGIGTITPGNDTGARS